VIDPPINTLGWKSPPLYTRVQNAGTGKPLSWQAFSPSTPATPNQIGVRQPTKNRHAGGFEWGHR